MRVKIYQPTKNAMQSGKAKSNQWLLEFDNEDARFIDPLMGWTGNSDTKSQLRLKFDSEEEAVAYATRQNYNYRVLKPKKATPKIRSYASNFTS